MKENCFKKYIAAGTLMLLTALAYGCGQDEDMVYIRPSDFIDSLTEAQTSATTAATAETTVTADVTTEQTVPTTALTSQTTASTAQTSTSAQVTTVTTAAATTAAATAEPVTEAPAPAETQPPPPPQQEEQPVYAPPEPEPQPEPEPEPVPSADIVYVPEPDGTTASVSTENFALQVACLVNRERTSRGLAPLKYSDTLGSMAQLRAGELPASFDHTRPDGRRCFSVYDDWGIDYTYVAENIAAGQTDPVSVMDSWMTSEFHRNNILSPNIEYIGVGVLYSGGICYWTQSFAQSAYLSGYSVEFS